MCLLDFRSRRSHLRITNKNVGPAFEDIGCCSSVSISDSTGATIGLLRLDTDALPIEDHDFCEFIAISETTTKLRECDDTFIGVLEETEDMEYLMQIEAFRQNKAPPTWCRYREYDSRDWSPEEKDAQRYYREIEALSEILESYEFVNVLWVEWIDGMAYRKGLGRIIKDAWEVQNLEEIDVVLVRAGPGRNSRLFGCVEERQD